MLVERQRCCSNLASQPRGGASASCSSCSSSSSSSTTVQAMTQLRRVYVGGLPPGVTAPELRGRFAPFGQVEAVEMLQPDATGLPRDFAYVSLRASDEQWRKCVALYAGSKWRGVRLRVQEAKPDYRARIQQELEAKDKPASAPAPARAVPRRRSRVVVSHAADMAPVTDEAVATAGRKGWRLTKAGRAIAVMRYSVRLHPRLRKRGRKIFAVNPTKFAPHIRHRFGADRDTPVTELTWRIPENAAAAKTDGDDDHDSKRRPADSSEIFADDENTLRARLDTERNASLRIFERMFGGNTATTTTNAHTADDDDDDASSAPAATAAPPPHPTPARFAVVPQPLRSLFATNLSAEPSGGFSFAAALQQQHTDKDDDADDVDVDADDDNEVFHDHVHAQPVQAVPAAGATSAYSSSSSALPFFFHFADAPRPGCASSVDDYARLFFARRISEHEAQQHWKAHRTELTSEFKRTHKSANRQKQKALAKKKRPHPAPPAPSSS